LAKDIFTEEYSSIENLMASSDKKVMHDAKRRKFQLHRKLLYYLNKLIKEKILTISRIQEKGEKVFGLALEDGEISIEKGYKKILITKPALPSNQIEQYEKTKIMKKYEEQNWITKFNSIVLECSKFPTLDRLNSVISECFDYVNDVIALNEFELVLSLEKDRADLKSFLEKLASEAADKDRKISLMINAINADAQQLKEFVIWYAALNPKKMNIVFILSTKDIQKYSQLFEVVIQEFSKQKIKINIRNKDISSTPIFNGRAGVYTFDEEDWRTYQKSIKNRVIGLCCSQLSIAISINRFFEIYKTDTEFRSAILNIAKTLLSASTLQRRKSNEYFRGINMLNNPNSSDFYKYSRNYIRFWNYDWHKDIEENNYLFDLINSSKDQVDRFCFSEETIFKSCGIPIRFKIVFSSAFRNFDAAFMGERDYRKATVKNVEDLHKGEMKKFLSVREKMFEIFDGGDRLRIFRNMDFEVSDILHEWNVIMSSYKIPFFTYDFSGLKGMVKLTNFI